ncbi:MAG TPA: preprotein translocase subunit SecG [Myxococcota bacterium]|jgi:preprotein translocase subunit SecG|nr:preprotein translocase subunit SecG [Myxococcota bacterium]
MSLFLTVVHVLVCVFLIVVVLLQRGKGADIGAVFGSGSGATLFGSRGAGNFLTRLTTGAAVVFMLTSLSLAYFAQEGARSTLLEDDAPAAGEPTSPFAEPEAGAPAQPEGGGFEQVPAPSAPEAPPADAQPEAPAGKAAQPDAPAPPPAKSP